ncbi:MAG: hypothetical protein ABW167_05285 [Baekduia sp.]
MPPTLPFLQRISDHVWEMVKEEMADAPGGRDEPVSYARFAEDCNVYVFISNDALECCSCWLQGRGTYRATSTAEMIVHLDKHRRAGHLVPDWTYDGLREDQGENDAWLGALPTGVDPAGRW